MKQHIKQILDIADKTYYNWKKEKRPVITLLEKYFTQEELEEFLETGTIEKMEADITQAAELINKLKKYYKVGTIQELADKLGVKQNTISGWKQKNSVNAIKRKIYELDLPIDLKDDKRDKYEELEKEFLFWSQFYCNKILLMIKQWQIMLMSLLRQSKNGNNLNPN